MSNGSITIDLSGPTETTSTRKKKKERKEHALGLSIQRSMHRSRRPRPVAARPAVKEDTPRAKTVNKRCQGFWHWLPLLNLCLGIVLLVLLVVHIQHDVPTVAPAQQAKVEVEKGEKVFPFNLVPNEGDPQKATVGLAQSGMEYGRLAWYDLCCSVAGLYVCHSGSSAWMECLIESNLKTGALVANVFLKKKASRLVGARCKLFWTEE